MIKTITIHKVSSYTGEKQVIEAKSINFLFGLNGTGKTTISRYMQDPDNPCYDDCFTEWENSKLQCEVAVYNSDYVKKNFSESSIPGIFTLGEENIQTKEKIQQYTDEIIRLEKQAEEQQSQLKNDETGLQNFETQYIDTFWKEKQRLDQENSPLLNALKGYRGKKVDFKQKLLSEYSVNKEVLIDKNDLAQSCKQLYSKQIEKRSRLPIPDLDSLHSLERETILENVIVGREDVYISQLIKKLGNEGWVRQGLTFMEHSNGKCPFCQRPLEKEFSDKLGDYFDETYSNAVQKIENIYSAYVFKSSQLLTSIKTIIDDFPDLMELKELPGIYLQLQSKIKDNIQRLLDKKNTPNIRVHLYSTREITEAVSQMINAANKGIDQYNAQIDNIKEEREKLSAKVWRYILHDLDSDIERYLKERKDLENRIRLTKKKIQSVKTSIAEKYRDRRSLEKGLTSVEPTVYKINEFLRNYGIMAFSLKVDEATQNYQFVRGNGDPALETLSEGERNFVTFLYFMYSLRGNTDEGGHNVDKVVVIDDPVSSLDSDILFIVSSLIRDLFEDICAEEGTIKQIFILSHNIFFFKEVSYDQGIPKKQKAQMKYWMITKNNNISTIKNYKANPIKSTYEMLWDEVKNASKNPEERDTVSLANTMRRIIEYYFKLLGNVDLREFQKALPDGDRQIFKALLSWVNAGSHSAFDDCSVTPIIYTSEKYLQVFREFFNKTGQIAHYNMMMGLDGEENKNGQDEV